LFAQKKVAKEKIAPLIPILHGYRSIELVIASEVKQSISLKKMGILDCRVTYFLAMTWIASFPATLRSRLKAFCDDRLNIAVLI